MAVLKVLQYPDPRLKQVSAPVTVFDAALHAFLADLEEAMRAGPGSVGIAAPQVNRFLRVAIVDVSSKPGIPHHGCLRLINPEIVRRAGEVKGREGCMSVPDYTGTVVRAQSVRVLTQDADGQWHEYDCEAFEARAVQHEIDHLDGLLFLDRVVSARHDLFRRKVKQF
ncbi:MAG TPA: peptide deformylase [Acidiferrobacterales bacterium]|nr:peptide deformylase [Acidiferrobacterales bacterium]